MNLKTLLDIPRGRYDDRRRSPRGRYDDRRGGYDDRRGGYDRYDDRRGGRYDDRDRGYGGKRDGYGKGGGKGYGKRRGESTTDKGQYKITIKHLPDDMTWAELKELGKEYIENDKDSVTFSRTFRNQDGVQCGILEFKTREHADIVTEKLDGRKFRGQETRLEVQDGDQR